MRTSLIFSFQPRNKDQVFQFFFTPDTLVLHQELKNRLTSIIRNAFIKKINGNRRYKYLVLGHEETYFVKEHSDSKNKYSEDDIVKKFEFPVDIIFVVFAAGVFKKTVGIPMGTNCAALLADIFLHSYEADFIEYVLSRGKKQLASRFNLIYRYNDDVLFINNQNSKVICSRCILLNLRSRSPQRASLLLLTTIYCCLLGGMVNFTLPFTTNEMISISNSQTFRL